VIKAWPGMLELKLGGLKRMLMIALILGGLMTQTAAQSDSCTAPEHRQFDFWIGDWEVFDLSSGSKGQLAGTNRVVKLLKDCVIQEHWEGSGGGQGSSFNSYFELDKKWHQTWVDDSGFRLELEGEFKDGQMLLEGRTPGPTAGKTVQRITWNLVNGNPDEVRQFWQQSRDDGKTWMTAFDGLYVRKK
jgi:hypothetical protein